MRKVFFILMMIISLNNGYSQSMKVMKSALDFSNEIDSAGLVFTMPKGYHLVPIKTDPDLNYAFAIKHDREAFEVRYMYWPLKDEIEQYKKCMVDTFCQMKDPNRAYVDRMTAKMAIIAGGVAPPASSFPKPELRSEMHCDDGAFVFFTPTKEYADGYSVVQTVALHKDNVADVLVVFYSKDKTRHDALMPPVFPALTFKP